MGVLEAKEDQNRSTRDPSGLSFGTFDDQNPREGVPLCHFRVIFRSKIGPFSPLGEDHGLQHWRF